MSDAPGPEQRRPGVPPPPPGASADGPNAPAGGTTPLPPPASSGGGGQPQSPPAWRSDQAQPPPAWGSDQAQSPPAWGSGAGGVAAPGGPASWSPEPRAASSGSNGVALAAMVTGIVSLLFAVVGLFVLPLFLSIPGGVVAIVLGVIGRRRAKAGAERSGQAVTGLVAGIVALVVSAIWIIVVVVLGSQFVAEFSDEVAELEACIEETGDEDLCTQRFSEELFEQLEP